MPLGTTMFLFLPAIWHSRRVGGEWVVHVADSQKACQHIDLWLLSVRFSVFCYSMLVGG